MLDVKQKVFLKVVYAMMYRTHAYTTITPPQLIKSSL